MFEFKDVFLECFADVELLLQDANSRGAHMLFEGAQGFLLDIDHGTYPYVTSSRTGISAAYSSGITEFQQVIGVMKAYSTRVGSGPFPTEMNEETAAIFRDLAKEFGTTTGRARRIGWLDKAALQYFVRMNGVTALALTRLDILDEIFDLRIGAAYHCLEHQLSCNNFECVIDNRVHGVEYTTMRGWAETTYVKRSGYVACAKILKEFPEEAREYCRYISQNVAPIVIVSNGPEREDTIIVNRGA